MGYRVTIAENGKEALEALEKDSYDLIFMDMMMPVMNGYTATQKLRSKGCVLPIIALTANAMKGDDQKCYEAGCNDGHFSAGAVKSCKVNYAVIVQVCR
jgi:CheY-like chemotaxis protein